MKLAAFWARNLCTHPDTRTRCVRRAFKPLIFDCLNVNLDSTPQHDTANLNRFG